MPGANLTNEQRKKIVWFLQERANPKNKNGLYGGAIGNAATEFNCSHKTVKRIWTTAQSSEGLADSKKKGRCGRKMIDRADKLETMTRLPLKQRQTVRQLSANIGMPSTSAWRMLKRGEIKRASSTVKPLLTEDNKLQRLQFCLDNIRGSTYEFHDNANKVHIDEKWFFITKVKNTYYLLPDEEVPHRSVQSKRFITKVMFLAAVGRPQFNEEGDCVFNGLLGIWPFVQKEEAKRNSKNRPKGTLVTKSVDVNSKVFYNAVVDKVFPAIRENMPSQSKCVVVQQDNAKPHSVDMKKLRDEGLKDGWDISVCNQPANSPDFNVLDLGFFSSIQSLQQEKCMMDIDELISATKEAYWDENPQTLDSVWLTLQTCMEASMLEEGNNKYKVPHMGKNKLRKVGKLPRNIKVSQEAIDIAVGKLEPSL